MPRLGLELAQFDFEFQTGILKKGHLDQVLHSFLCKLILTAQDI